MNAEDWAFWRDGAAPEVCAAEYLTAIENVGRGIVLMHDCTADEDTWQRSNATYEVVRILVPQLKVTGISLRRSRRGEPRCHAVTPAESGLRS